MRNLIVMESSQLAIEPIYNYRVFPGQQSALNGHRNKEFSWFFATEMRRVDFSLLWLLVAAC